jgi:hypothetical protein
MPLITMLKLPQFVSLSWISWSLFVGKFDSVMSAGNCYALIGRRHGVTWCFLSAGSINQWKKWQTCRTLGFGTRRGLHFYGWMLIALLTILYSEHTYQPAISVNKIIIYRY